jgi:IS30 family transposase
MWDGRFFAVKSGITYDRGIEFADYEAVQKALDIKIHFADAYSSW